MEPIKIVGILLVGTSAILMLICLFRKNENFFNLRNLLAAHFGLFKNCKLQYFIFYGLPLLFAVGLAMIYEAGETFYSNLSVIVSILLSMLLAILSILTGKEYNSVNDEKRCESVQQVVKETITAIIFDALMCVFLLLYGLVMVVIDDINFDTGIAKSIFAGITYYNFTVILLNLLLIVKRMSKIIEFNLSIRKKK